MPNSLRFPVLLAMAFSVGAIALTGCTTGSDNDSNSSQGMDPQMSYSESSPADMAMESGQKNLGQQYIRTGSVSMTSDDTLETVVGITALVAQFNGSISQEDIRTIEDNDYANLTVRVPDSDLEEFVAEVRTLGNATAFSISEIDVTLTITDLDARINSLNTTIEKLEQLQEQATSVTDLVAVEAELATRSAERDSLVAQRDVVQSQVAESTVYLDVSPDLDENTSAPDFLGGVESGWQALINIAAGTVTLVGFLIPIGIAIILVIGLITVIAKFIKRARQRT